MTGVQKIWLVLIAGTLIMTVGCSQKKQTAPVKEPDVSLSCIGVMPVTSSIDYETEDSFRDAKSLKEGVDILKTLLQKEFLGRDDIRFIGKAHSYGVDDAASGDFITRARSAGEFLSCNGVLEITLWRYKDRIGGEYTAKEPASVSFTYRLVEVNSGITVCQGRYDEVQKSVMENLYNFGTAMKRGFTWVTAKELLQEGIEDKLGECSYLQIDE
jgi:hypothetical protein